jgi:hypothetical protein
MVEMEVSLVDREREVEWGEGGKDLGAGGVGVG